MPEIIKGRQVVSDDWTILKLAEGDTADSIVIPEGKVIVPLAVWNAQRDACEARSVKGLWLASDEQESAIEGDVNRFDVIGLDFPKFTDGRAYSTAFNLRTRMKFSRELRAIGDVLRDQLFYMQRVGFDAFAVRADKNIHDALNSLSDFTLSYQASTDDTAPLFRRLTRPGRDQVEASAS